jgi:type III pantothenate kinase
MSRRILQMDVGNTQCKWRLLEDATIRARGRGPSSDLAVALGPLLDCDRPDEAWVASVASEQDDSLVSDFLASEFGIAARFAVPQRHFRDLTICYDDPARLGVDRWLAMLAARARFRERICVIDAGSALTIDFVDSSGRHEGGFILPGRRLLQQSLLSNTRRIVYTEYAEAALEPACSTADAVERGCLLAMCGGIELSLRRSAAHAGETPRLILTGGDAPAIQSLLDHPLLFVEDLVFEGLDCLQSAPAMA